MPDSQTNEALTSSKLEYESAIGLSQHVPQAKTISEMVLDAFQTAKESEEIRELRAAIRLAQDEHDDDKAYELMGQLKLPKRQTAQHWPILARSSRSAVFCPATRMTRHFRNWSTAWRSRC